MSNNTFATPLSRALKALLPSAETSISQKPPKSLEGTSIEPATTHPSATSVVPTFLKELFNQAELLLKSQTTYAKSHYFPNGQETKERVLIKERFLQKPTPLNCPQIHFGAKFQFNTKGQLQQASNGLIYLKIDEDFIDKLHPLIQEPGVIKPSDSLGAHIPIISPEEWSGLELEHFNPSETTHCFSILECQKLSCGDLPDVDSVWVLTMHSPSLELLRENYRLPTKLHSQEFRVVFAIKPTSNDTIKKKHELYYFRTNAATTSYA